METPTSPQKPHIAPMGELIRTAWDIFKKKPLLTYAIIIIPFVLSMILQGSLGWISETESAFTILSLAYWIFMTTITIGTITIGLKIVRGETATLNDWGSNAHRILYYIGGSVITGIITFIGLILFIVPGVYYGIRLMFVPTLLIDTEMGIMEAMDASAKMTDGIKWDLFWYSIGFGIMAVLGTLFTLGLGLIAIAPLATLIPLVLYVQLKPKALPTTTVQ